MDNIFPTHADQLVVSLWSKSVLVIGIWFEVVSIERSATLWPGHSGAFSLRAAGRAGSGDGSPSPIHLLSSRMTLTVVQWVFWRIRSVQVLW